MTAAEAISAKTTIVQRRLERINARNGRRVLLATTADISARLTAYCTLAEIATAPTTAPVPVLSSPIRATKGAAAAAASAKEHAL
jgi:hypothetical protein